MSAESKVQIIGVRDFHPRDRDRIRRALRFNMFSAYDFENYIFVVSGDMDSVEGVVRRAIQHGFGYSARIKRIEVEASEIRESQRLHELLH